MVALIPWWSRILITVLVIAIGVTLGAYLGGVGVPFLLVFYPILIAAHLGTEALRPGGSLRSSGLGITPLTVQQLALGGAIAVLSIGVIVVIAISLGAWFEASTIATNVSWFGLLVLTSVGEEVLFRGTIFDALRERFRANVAVAVTSVLFGVAHLGNDGSSIVAVINVTCAGVLLGAMVVRTSSLWMSIGYHVAWNSGLHLFVGSVSGSENSGVFTHLVTNRLDPAIRWIVDGPFGVEQGLAATIVLLAGLVATAGWARPDRYVRAARLRRMRREHEFSRSN